MECSTCRRPKPSDRFRICDVCRPLLAEKQRAVRANLTEAKRAEIRETDRRKKREWYAALSPEHRARIQATVRENSRKNQRRYHLNRYRITEQLWNAMFEAQGRKCGICRRRKPGGRGWNTDHDHATGRVRGILCCACNRGLGNLGDSAEILRRAILYLRR